MFHNQLVSRLKSYPRDLILSKIML